jgi:hypothetical protein
LDPENAKKIVCNAVETTRPIWEAYDEHWSEIDRIFLIRAYEQGGFETWKFAKLLYFNSIFSIEKIGSILDGYTGARKYVREFAGSVDSLFYKDLKAGIYGFEGEKFYKSAKEFKGKFGSGYWMQLWRMLVCCHDLKNKYQSSFSFYLKTKYGEFKNRKISNEDFHNISIEEWEEFKKVKKPWNELYGIGINVFDFIVGDVGELKFVRDSFKLDSSNEYFIEVTGIYKGPCQRAPVKNFFKSLNLPYKLREINTGIFLYCSEAAKKDFGFCRNPHKCLECSANEICEKNFDKNKIKVKRPIEIGKSPEIMNEHEY